MVALKKKETENSSAWEQKLPPCNFQASYAREFADWIAIKRDARNQVMEVTCNWYCCFLIKKQADASSKFVLGYKDPFKRETFKIYERSVSHRNCKQLYKTEKNPEDTPLAKCMLKMDMEVMENLKKLFITAHFIAYWNKP